MTPARQRLAAALAAAASLHVLILFGISLPTAGADHERSLSVTLSTAPGPRRQDTAVIAAAEQAGTDAASGHSRRAPRAPGDPDAPDRQRRPDGTAERSDTTPIIAHRSPKAATAVGRGRRQAGGGSTASDDARTERRNRAAVADLRAGYLEDWRRAIERSGSRAFPAAARASDPRRLTVEVTLTADGNLVATRIRRSSGDPELDAATRRILRQAAPFAPFPGELRRRWNRLTFAYDWVFLPSQAGGLRVKATGKKSPGAQ